MRKKTNYDFVDEQWYTDLSAEGRYTYDLIYKYHKYFNNQDKKYRSIVRIFQLTIFIFSMVNTIVLGLKSIIEDDYQIVIGLVISALITFVTAISSYFNFEDYWMRNITIHIELNVLRDNFKYDALANKLKDEENIEKYRIALEDIQIRNKEYWQRTLTRTR